MLPVASGYARPPYRDLLRDPQGRTQFLSEVSARAEARDAEKKAAETRAEAEVDRWGDREWTQSLFERDQRKDAIDHVASARFGRTATRTLRAEKQAVRWLEAIVALDARLASPDLDPAARAAHVAEQAALAEKVIELLESARLNASSTFTNRIREVLYKVPLKFVSPTALACCARSPHAPAIDVPPGETDPRPSSFWHPRRAAALSPAAVYRGVGVAGEGVPELPRLGERLRLKEVRSADGGGTHPSVEVEDPRGQVWKVKFHGEQAFLEEPIATRLYDLAGWNVLPKFTVPGRRLDLDPRAVLAADLHKPWTRFLGVPIRSEYPLEDYVESLTLSGGGTKSGRAAVELLRAAERDRARLGEIASVRVKNFDLTLKTDDAKSIGPWHSDQLSHPNLRPVRAMGMMSTYVRARDHKTSNFRLDLKKREADGEVELVHLASDLGLTLEPKRPDRLGDGVGAHPRGWWLHNNANMGRLDAFDAMTLDDARWFLRRLGALSEGQLLGAVAASHASWPVVRYVTDRLVARRDDLMRDFGLEREFPPLRTTAAAAAREVPDEDFELELPGGVSEPPQKVFLARDGHSIEGGRLLKDGAPLGPSIDCMTVFCPTSDPRAT